MVLFPNAKINLGLNILSRRPDGYHNIETLMIPIKWADILEIVPASGQSDRLILSGNPVNCPTEKNLVWKALMLMRAHVDFPAVDIYLRKIVPDGAGLGGGSSDAAFTLTALDRLFNLDIPADRLRDIASQLGADCPFFIDNKPALATGTGTCLSPMPHFSLPATHLAIVKPPVSIPTAQAYAGVTPHQPEISLTQAISMPVETWRNNLVNDFEASIAHAHPVIAAIKQTLYSLGATYAAMSGSGSAVFGIFDTDIVADNLSHLFPDSIIFCDKLV